MDVYLCMLWRHGKEGVEIGLRVYSQKKNLRKNCRNFSPLVINVRIQVHAPRCG